MSYEVNKITNEMLDGKGVVGLPNTPQLSASEMQRKFDEVAVEVIVPAFNTLCDALDVGGGEENERFIAVETDIANIYDVEIPALVQNIEDAKESANTYTDEKIGELPVVPEWALAEEKPTYTAEEVGALPDTTFIPTKTSDLENDSGFLTEHQDISGKQDKLIPGDRITIENNVISAKGTDVSVNPIRTSGAHIADITIDEEVFEIYAPNDGGGGGGTTTSYADLDDLPELNGEPILGNKPLATYGIASAADLNALSEIVGQANALLEGV